MAPAPGAPAECAGERPSRYLWCRRAPDPAATSTRVSGRAGRLRDEDGHGGTRRAPGGRAGRHRHRHRAAAGGRGAASGVRCPAHTDRALERGFGRSVRGAGAGDPVLCTLCAVPGVGTVAGSRRSVRGSRGRCSVPSAPRGAGKAGLGSARRVHSAQHPGASSSPFPLIGAARRVPVGRSRRAGPPRVLALTMGSGGAAASLTGRRERRRRGCPSRPGLARRGGCAPAPCPELPAAAPRFSPPSRELVLRAPAPAGGARHGPRQLPAQGGAGLGITWDGPGLLGAHGGRGERE